MRGTVTVMVPSEPKPARTTVTADDITRAVAAGIVSNQLAGAGVPIDEELWERRMRAATLRNMGCTFTRIAAELGISASVARADVRLAYREVLNETTEDFVARQRSVLLDCQRGAYPLAMQGDKDSIMAIVRCLEQEAKLLGLYAPARMAVGISDVDFAEQAAELIAKLGLQPPRELMPHGRSIDAAGVAVAGVAGAGAGSVADELVDAGEIVDGIVERFIWPAGVVGFDLPAFDLPLGAEPLGADIGDAAISAAAAAAIDPERFGEPCDGERGGGARDGRRSAVRDSNGDDGGAGGGVEEKPWSNL